MEIHWRKAEALSAAEKELARERIESLAHGHRDLIDVWIDVEPSSPHHRKGAERVSIRAQVRGATIVAHAQEEELRPALRAALDRFDREILRLRDKRQDRRVARPPSSPPHLGIVDRIFAEDGYGFLLSDGGEQIYFHRNALSAPLSFEELEEGARVAFNYEPGEKGPQASVVTAPPPGAPTP
jgi:cold shock CspA family protein/ribosome-associated translation inhibitor RaiA